MLQLGSGAAAGGVARAEESGGRPLKRARLGGGDEEVTLTLTTPTATLTRPA